MNGLLAGPYGHPYHPMLVTVPIGAWVASLLFDIASHLVSRPGFLTQGSEWLIAAGVLGAMAAGIAGFLDLAAIPAGTAAFRTACTHMCISGERLPDAGMPTGAACSRDAGHPGQRGKPHDQACHQRRLRADPVRQPTGHLPEAQTRRSGPRSRTLRPTLRNRP